MKLTIPAKTLAKTLASAARVVEHKTTIPVLAHFYLEAGEALTIRGTDLDLEFETRIPANVEARGAICAPAATLADMVRKFDDKVDVRMEMDGEQLIVRAGRSRMKLGTLPAADYPDIAAKQTPHAFETPAKSLAAMLERTAFAISNEETRYYLNGVYLHFARDADRQYLRAVTTDGHRLARFDAAPPDGCQNMPGVIVPRKTVETLLRMLKDAGDETARIELCDTLIRFRLGETSLTSKLIDGTFPDYARVIPTNGDKRASLDAEALAQAVARVATISSERGRAVKFAFSNDRLALSVTNPDMGEARDEIDVEWDGPAFEVGFNGAYVQTVLAALTGGNGRVIMKFTDPGAPCVLTSASDDAMLAVLMPMRV